MKLVFSAVFVFLIVGEDTAATKNGDTSASGRGRVKYENTNTLAFNQAQDDTSRNENVNIETKTTNWIHGIGRPKNGLLGGSNPNTSRKSGLGSRTIPGTRGVGSRSKGTGSGGGFMSFFRKPKDNNRNNGKLSYNQQLKLQLKEERDREKERRKATDALDKKRKQNFHETGKIGYKHQSGGGGDPFAGQGYRRPGYFNQKDNPNYNLSYQWP